MILNNAFRLKGEGSVESEYLIFLNGGYLLLRGLRIRNS
jgi:hypothetical protein